MRNINPAIYLMRIKMAFESGVFSLTDQSTLKILFGQGILYKSILTHDILCSGDVCDSLASFYGLVDTELANLTVKNTEMLSLPLTNPETNDCSSQLSPTLLKRAKFLHTAVMTSITSVFHTAILYISNRLESEEILSEVDIENANYIVGMSEITLRNLEMAVVNCWNLADENYDQLNKFFEDSLSFASSLKKTTSEKFI